MILTYLRSSSLGTWKMCPHKYFISYVLGIDEKSNKSAEKGTVFHKVMEIRANIKLYGLPFTDDTIGLIEKEDYVDITERVYQYITSCSPHKYLPADYKDCQKWVQKILNTSCDPINLPVLEAEKFFEYELPYKWAHYEFDIDGNKIEGQLKLRGTIDLILQHDDDTLELWDWKSGSRVDWSNNRKTKTFADLMEDSQLRLYHYVAHKIYPNIKQILVTINYINDGGPVTICFDNETDITVTEAFLQKSFNDIKKQITARLRKGSHCNFCHYYKEQYKDSGKNICSFMENQVYQIGMTSTIKKYGDLSQLNIYTGGGKKDVEIK